jgi:hypothetical protein
VVKLINLEDVSGQHVFVSGHFQQDLLVGLSSHHWGQVFGQIMLGETSFLKQLLSSKS